MAKIKVLVSGAAGRMGNTVIKAVLQAADMDLVGAVDPAGDVRSIIFERNQRTIEVPLTEDITEKSSIEPATVMVDFSLPDVCTENVSRALKLGMNCVVGTTGLDDSDYEKFEQLSGDTGRNVIVVPNFAIGAVLMMKFSQMAAQWMSAAEIIEMHHDRKIDAPSGTAIMTAAEITKSLKSSSKDKPRELIKINGARGGGYDGVQIHSVRLPGLMAHQMVIFGDESQTLTIRHDSLARESFMPGVLLAVRKISELPGLTIGLDQVMGI